MLETTCSVHISDREQKINLRHNADKNYRDNLSHTDNSRKIEILEDKTNENFQLDLETKIKILEEMTFDNGKKIQDYLDEYNKGKKQCRQKTLEKLATQKNTGGDEFFKPKEMIFQIGNKEVQETLFADKNFNRDEAVEILKKEFELFKEKTKNNCSIIQAVIHDDETTPHLHLVFIPLTISERQKGLPVSSTFRNMIKNTLTEEQKEQIKTEIQEEQKIASLDFDPLTREKKKPSKKTERQIQRDLEIKEFSTWRNSIVEDMTRISETYNYEIKNPNRKIKEHLNTNENRKVEEIIQNAKIVDFARQKLAESNEKVEEAEQLQKAFKLPNFNDLAHSIIEKYNNLAEQFTNLKNNLFKKDEKIQILEEQVQQKEARLSHIDEDYQEQLYQVGKVFYREESNLQELEQDNTIYDEVKDIIYKGYQSEEREYDRDYSRQR